MDCALLYLDYTDTGSPNYTDYSRFYAGISKVNTYDFEDDGNFVDSFWDYTYFYNLDYPNYGFSSTQFGSTMNIDDNGIGEGEYWFDYNAGNGYMHFHRFLAVHDERLDIGDTLTVWLAEYENDEVMSTSLELASGVSLAASAAAVLASATLL